MSELPAHVVREDKQLETAASSASEELARLRWHWTLDESNSGRVSLHEYARATDRNRRAIVNYAKGYALWKGGEEVFTLSEAIERASMSAEREAAVEAVADARGLSFSQARQSRPSEVKRIRDIARERVEKQGGTIEEETARAAAWIVRAEKVEKGRQADRKERLGLRLVELEGHLDAMRRRGEIALTVARDVDWEDDQQELLRATLANVRALLNLIDVALAGVPDVDWDAELNALRGAEA